ncbi:von willebrand factor type A domain protein, putative [Yasminevirus sp. GU-2018]|uniref:von willebrand factor type A domain protein, putative n=1 Tax=Yasminevirus sp. GU-2018 TaxID=2420051 RepID=A0A5K0UA91_9VIRU|nr:von willebrand factor type A domain protein, putative [Yasminevirus sp. GU-2018]
MTSLKDLKESITDSVTFEVFVDPYGLPCGHTYSKSVLDGLIATRGYNSAKCPQCRNPFTETTMKPNFTLRATIPATLKMIEQLEQQEQVQELLQQEAMTREAGLSQAQGSGSGSGAPVAPIAPYKPSLSVMSAKGYNMITVGSPDGKSTVPVDLVICVDVSGSMSEAVTRKGEHGEDIDDGFSTLDIVKHAAKALIKGMRPQDRVGIVSFSADAQTVLSMTVMTEENKRVATEKISGLSPDGHTNLWAGIESSLNMLRSLPLNMHRASYVCLLTDGVPTASCAPTIGYKKALARYQDKYPTFKCTLNTIGFGYNLDSTLLDELSQQMNGSYLFVPDGTLVGTVFTHIGANAAVNVGSNAVLKIAFSDEKDVQTVLDDQDTDIDTCYTWSRSSDELQIHLGNINYGQNRTICIPGTTKPVAIMLTYTNNETHAEDSVSIDAVTIRAASTFAENVEVKAQLLRQIIVSNVRRSMNMATCGDLEGAQKNIDQTMKKKMTPLGISTGTVCADIMKDMSGQIAEAFSRKDWYVRWGRHYLPSLVRAHITQQCNNFKDPGVQSLGGKLFQTTRDTIDDLFNTLPQPQTSRRVIYNSYVPVAPVQMSSYNSSSGPCFRGDSLVSMYDGTLKRVDQINAGDKIVYEDREFEVQFVVKTKCAGNSSSFVRVVKKGVAKPLHITPNHPVYIERSDEKGTVIREWCRPADLAGSTIGDLQFSDIFEEECEHVYTFAVKGGFAINIGGVTCVTLGHGLKGNFHIEHPFYGTSAIIDALKSVTGRDSGGVLLEVGAVLRDSNTSWVVGFDSNKVKAF